jgi:hypothetical protein
MCDNKLGPALARLGRGSEESPLHRPPRIALILPRTSTNLGLLDQTSLCLFRVDPTKWNYVELPPNYTPTMPNLFRVFFSSSSSFFLPSHESRWPCVPPAFHNRMVQTDLLLRNYLVGEQCLNDPAPSTQTVCRKEFQGDREKNTTVVIKLQNSLYPLPIACICVIPPSKLC